MKVEDAWGGLTLAVPDHTRDWLVLGENGDTAWRVSLLLGGIEHDDEILRTKQQRMDLS